MSADRTPPRLARTLLRRFVPDDAGDDIEGDLHELWAERRAASGAVAAAGWYWLETFSLAMRFTIDRVARALRGLAGGAASPSGLDIKLGFRMLGKSPGLALVGGFGMAVAVALGAGAYAVVNSYFYPELPLHEGDRVIAIGKFDALRHRENEQIAYDFLAWKRELRTVTDLGAFRNAWRNLVPASGQGETITLAEMTASGFRVARTPPLLGRTLIDADEQPGAPPVVVIGYDAWQTRFAGDPAVVGEQVRLGRTLHTIVGVMPEEFGFPVSHQWWIPLRLDPGAPPAPGTGPWLDVFGRLAPGVTKEQAQAELTVVAKRLATGLPPELAVLESRITPYTDIFVNAEAEGEAKLVAVLRFLIALLLVVVAMNVAVLVYARTVTRTTEIAVRTALGATRARIVAQLFGEAFVLSALSALAGLGLVAIGLRMFDRSLEDFFGGRAPFWMQTGLSAGTVLYALALAVLAAVIIGVFPALRATGAQLRSAMGSLGSGTKAQLGKTWTTLVVAQIAIAVAVMPTALLKGWEIAGMSLRDAGFPTHEYLATNFKVELDPSSGTAQGEPGSDAHADSLAADSASNLVRAFMARLAEEPGVTGATVSIAAPWSSGGSSLEAEGTPAVVRASSKTVDEHWAGTFDVRLAAGRVFGPADLALPKGDRPVVVNRTFVAELLGPGDPVGKRVRYRGYGDDTSDWITIAGVVEDFPPGMRTPGFSGATIYHLESAAERRTGLLVVRLRGQAPGEFVPALRRVATSVDPALQLFNTTPLDAMYRAYTRESGRIALVVALVTGSVLLLSAAGIHALMAFAVNQRRREIGIRSALGAPAGRILASVLARAARQLALGVGIGLAAATGLEVATGGEAMGGSGLWLVPATALFMLVVGMIAAAGPARRGLQVQPTEALRAD